MAGQQIHGFRGVNLRKDRLQLADEELAYAVNADLHSVIGSIILRKGRTAQFASALTQTNLRRLAKTNGVRYQCGGQTLYRNQAAILSGGLSSLLVTTFQAFRPLSDSTLWTFIADDALMQKDDGTNLRVWGIVGPITAAEAPVVAAGYGTTLSGIYFGQYTRIRFSGTAVAHESNPSTASTAVTLATEDLTYGDLLPGTDAQVNGLGIYRSVASGASALEVAKLALPTTDASYAVTFGWEASCDPGSLLLQFTHGDATSPAGIRRTFTWEDDTTVETNHEDANGYTATSLWEIAQEGITQTSRWAYASQELDAALGTAVDADNDPPPVASFVAEFQSHFFLTRDAANPHYLWWSKRFRPESWPTSQFIEIGNPDDPIQALAPMAGLLGVLTRKTKHRVLGNATSGFVPQETVSKRGTPSPFTVVPTEKGTMFLARDGIWLTNFLAEDQELSEAIHPLFEGDSVNGYSPINMDDATAMLTASAAAYKGKLYVAVPTGSSTTPDILWVLSRTTGRWYAFDHPCRTLSLEEDVDDLVAGFTDGFAYILEDGVVDDTSSIALSVQTRDGFGQQLAVRKVFLWAKVDAEVPTGETASVGLYVDGTLKSAQTISGSRTKVLLPFPEASMGYEWRLTFAYTGSGAFRVHGVEVLWLPLEPS